jgi:hypothetical protein
MSDNLSKRGGSDRRRIDISQDYELRDWAKQFGVSPDALKKAVAAVGDDAGKVAEHLGSGSQPGSESASQPRSKPSEKPGAKSRSMSSAKPSAKSGSKVKPSAGARSGAKAGARSGPKSGRS